LIFADTMLEQSGLIGAQDRPGEVAQPYRCNSSEGCEMKNQEGITVSGRSTQHPADVTPPASYKRR